MKNYIKFKLEWIKQSFFIDEQILCELNFWRNKLRTAHFIGFIDKTSYGNISIRVDNSQEFIITGSATGHLDLLGKQDIARIVDYNINENYVKSIGEIKPSSETLSHASIYQTLDNIMAVIHVHNEKLWTALYDIYPLTDESALYGTSEIAGSIKELLIHKDTREKKMIIMSGHRPGIISFGTNLQQAATIILDKYNQVCKKQNL